MSKEGLPQSRLDSVESIMEKIGKGMALPQCRTCGCMLEALKTAERVFKNAAEPDVHPYVDTVYGYLQQMEEIAYDCLGCEACWGAEATMLIGDIFGNEPAPCGCGSSCKQDAALGELPDTTAICNDSKCSCH